jgi:hypothetical protein
LDAFRDVRAHFTEAHEALSRETRFPLDEACLSRYLRAHNWDTGKAAAGIISTLKCGRRRRRGRGLAGGGV